ncbi:MAG: M20/M25/M40 family metallo-hydrolase [Thermoplasmata archaeon]|nr:MAG: M20/M25/M40 family metallo-hydrolase [Thermoplasmata archaeon]
MSKKIKLFVLFLVIVVIIAAVGVYALKQAQEATNYTIVGFDYQRAYNDCDYLTSIGPRLAGTDNEYQGAMYIKNQFQEAGLSNVHLESFSALLYEVNSASVSLVPYGPLGNLPSRFEDPIQYAHTIDFVAQGYSGSYIWSDFNDDLEIVDVGDGKDDLLFEEAQGKAAIVSQDENAASNTELFFRAEDCGVAALILHNTRFTEKLGYIPISKSTGLPDDESSYPDIPFFMVSNDVGNELKESINSNYKLRVDFDVTVEERDLWVVVGDVLGSEKPNEYVMLGAHHDTVYNGPGAIDNTVGTVTVIELARQLAKYEPKRTIRLVTWGGEEEGLFGSIMYVEKHRDDILKNCKMYLNFDMNNVDLERGNSLPLSVSDNKSIDHMENIAGQLLNKYKELKKYNIQIEYNDLKSGGSDQLIFARNDIKAAACWGSGSWEYHTYLDNIDHVNAESISVGGRIFGSYALYLAEK